MIWTIRNIDNEVMHEVEAETFLKAVETKKDDLHGADLREANLRGANLGDLIPNNSVSSLLQSIDWGILSDALTLEMMAHDAESCGIEKMDEWAKEKVENKSYKCPFGGRVSDYQFQENYKLWYDAKEEDKIPKLRGMQLLIALCKEKGIKTEGVE